MPWFCERMGFLLVEVHRFGADDTDFIPFPELRKNRVGRQRFSPQFCLKNQHDHVGKRAHRLPTRRQSY